MKEFFLDKFNDEQAYKRFIEYMLLHSDSFSLIHFKYRENESTKRSIKQILDSLKKYKISSKNTQKWPNTETQDTKHFYKLILYHSDIQCLDTLAQVKDIYNWDYPNAPMDLCFYRGGYCWMAVTGHEQMAYLYTDNKNEVEELQNLGAKLTLEGTAKELFYLNRESEDAYKL